MKYSYFTEWSIFCQKRADMAKTDMIWPGKKKCWTRSDKKKAVGLNCWIKAKVTKVNHSSDIFTIE